MIADTAIRVAAEAVGGPTFHQVATYRVAFDGNIGPIFHFSVRRWLALPKRISEPILSFELAIVAEPCQTPCRTTITSYTVTRDSFMFIPIAPKQMQGYPGYRAFITGFADVIRSQDPHATVLITG
ncbi:hypothetical protein ACFWPK_28535 [Nocardia sp. NPDC058519]|uniref:hypothetical protein n=1 Tax=Nocardia sp. NPDC058519 TaxID=3346535 RepID=UPI00366738ED